MPPKKNWQRIDKIFFFRNFLSGGKNLISHKEARNEANHFNLALSAFVGISSLSAGVDSNKSKATQTLSKADSEFLFGANAKNLNVEVLSQKELEETQGEFWPILLTGLGIGVISWIVDGSFEPYVEFGNR